MQTKKINLVIIFGGKSAEREVSVESARNIFKAINKKKYKPWLVGIDKKGNWLLISEKDLLNKKNPFPAQKKTKDHFVIPYTRDEKFFLKKGQGAQRIDVVFPVLHGPFGEDGTFQGFLKLANVPFVGAGILSSAVSMDKDVSKRLLKEAGIPIGNFLVYKKHQKKLVNFSEVEKILKLPFFVKPANLGSSVGVSKVKNKKEFGKAIKLAFSHDIKILIEEYIPGREIECSVLGNHDLIASIPGEVAPTHEFYSYEAKYIDEKGAVLSIPAKLDKKTVEKIQGLAKKVFETLNCEGMGRVDFFVTKNNQVLVNEINTIPGFTSISMYPKLLEHQGILNEKLIDELIKLARKRFNEEKLLK